MNSKHLWRKFAGLGLLLVLAAAAPRCEAERDNGKAKVPDWVLEAAKTPTPNYSYRVNAYVLLDSEQDQVLPNGRIEKDRRLVYKLVTSKGAEEESFLETSSDPGWKIPVFNGWTITADGKKYSRSLKDVIVHGDNADEDLYGDRRSVRLELPWAIPGNIVAYEFKQEGLPQFWELDWQFQRQNPIVSEQYQLTLPPGWEYRSYWLNHAKVEPVIQGNTSTWSLQDVAPVRPEPHCPEFGELAGALRLHLFSASNPLAQLNTWPEVSAWAYKLAASGWLVTPEIQQKAATLTAGCADVTCKVNRLARFVQKDVRYVEISLLATGYTPHPAPQVLRTQYGDCKDKAILLASLLKAEGIASYPLLVNTVRGATTPDFASPFFNHMILAVSIPAGAQSPSWSAIVNDPQLGRLLIIDGTLRDQAPGEVPFYLASEDALVVLPSGGKLIQIPTAAPSFNRLFRQGDFVLRPDGALLGNVTELRWGQPAWIARQVYDGPGTDNQRILDNFLRPYLSDFQAKIDSIQPGKRVFRMDYSVAAPSYLQDAGGYLMLRPCVLGSVTFSTLDPDHDARRYPVVFDSLEVRSDIYKIRIPAGYSLMDTPRPVKLDYPFASYESTIDPPSAANNYTLTYKRVFTVKELEVPTPEVKQLQQMFYRINGDEQNQLLLQRAASAPTAAAPAATPVSPSQNSGR